MQQQFPELDVSVREISAEELKSRLDSGEGLTLLDTRRPEDFDQWSLTHPNLTAINIPFTAFLDEDGNNPASSVPDGIPDERLVTCCAKGISSLYVAKYLVREGFDVLALEDGMEGWATLYEHRPIETEHGFEVIQFHRPSSGCLAYLCLSGETAAVIDPLQAFASTYQQVASERGATIEYVLDTHVHADHVSGVCEVTQQTDSTPIFPVGARDRGLEFEATVVDDGDVLSVGETTIECIELPGHTTEMMGYLFDGVFITGDTLFLDGVARPDLENRDKAKRAAGQLWETLQKLTGYPAETIIAPGHVSSTATPDADATFTAPLGSLKAGLAAFEEGREAFVERVLSDLPPRPNNFETIIAINLGQESVTPDEAFELELGPNNCAVGG